MARVGRLLQFARYISYYYDDTFHTAFPELESPSLFTDYVFDGPGRLYLMFENPDYNVGATIPVYRFWNPTLGDHYHTVQSSVGGGYIFEGVVGYVYGSSGPNRRAMYSFVSYQVLPDGRPSINHYASVDSVPYSANFISEGLAWYAPIVVDGCYDPIAFNYNVYVNQNSTGCLYPAPTATIFLSPSSIIRGGTSTLTWSTTNATSVSITNVGSVGTSGSITVSPNFTTIYTITATGIGGSVTSSVTLTVYIPPNVTFSLDSSTIVRGQCTTLRWTTTGDAGSATINQGIGLVNINGNRQVCPTETLTYTINVSGSGGSDSDSITLTVFQPPTVNLTGPVSLNYNQQGTLQYEATDANISLTLSPIYQYKNGSLSGPMFNVNLPTGALVNGSIQTQIPYNDFGPFSVTYVIVATGNGGQESKQITIPINIDETPDNFLVPESDDLLKEQAPIFTPDAVVTSYQIIINDIDIPVEIKADKPILIDKNNQQDWKRIREI